jgi:hypothetical protein
MNDKTGETVAVNLSVGPHGHAACKLLPNEEIIVTANDNLGVFITFTGEPVERNAIAWSSSPAVIEFTSPYVAAMIPNKGVEIHRIQDGALVQTMSIPRIVAMFGNGMKWDMEARPTGDSEDAIVVVQLHEDHRKQDASSASSSYGRFSSTILKIEQTPMDQQVTDLLERGRIEEASDLMKKSIAPLPMDKQKSRLRRFHRQVAIALLRRCEFDSAVEFIYRSGMDAREFLSFFPDMCPPSFAYEPHVLTPDVLPRGSSVSPDMKSVVAAALERDHHTGSSHSSSSSHLAPDILAMGPAKLYHQATIALMKCLEMMKKHHSRYSFVRLFVVSFFLSSPILMIGYHVIYTYI